MNPSLSHLKLFGSITYRHVSDQLKEKLDDKSSQMNLKGYHSIGVYKLFDLVNKKVVINMGVIICELKEWGSTENFKKESVKIFYEEPTSEFEREVRQEGFRGQEITIEPQRIKNMHARLQVCVITSDDTVSDKGWLVHYAFYVHIEQINLAVVLKDSKCMKVMNEELKSIEVKITWSLVDQPQGKKIIDVKWVKKVKLNLKE